VTVRISEAPGCTLVAVTGELDIYTAPDLRDAISGVMSAGVHDVVVDLTRVEFLDSTGLGVLVAALKRIGANGGSLQLVFAQERLFKLFSITGLAKVFVICDSVETAFANLALAAPTGQPPLADPSQDPVVPST
jgi:anti-sigma B factor antagonist